MLYCPPFSTVYNIFLCLHIFSVHITHQNKKRNYENLDQLSYDNKRGPKVYLHGQCTPPTNFPNVATRNQPKPATSRPRNVPLLVARVFFNFLLWDISLWFKWRMILLWKIYNFRSLQKEISEQRPAFIIFIFSFNKGMHVLRTRTHKKSLQVHSFVENR